MTEAFLNTYKQNWDKSIASKTKKSCDSDLIKNQIIDLGSKAMQQLISGSPSCFIGICNETVRFFSPYAAGIISGVPALEAHLSEHAASFHATEHSFSAQEVQIFDPISIYTFSMKTIDADNGGTARMWRCSEVYSRSGDAQWKIVQAHWSIVTTAQNQIANEQRGKNEAELIRKGTSTRFVVVSSITASVVAAAAIFAFMLKK